MQIQIIPKYSDCINELTSKERYIASRSHFLPFSPSYIQSDSTRLKPVASSRARGITWAGVEGRKKAISQRLCLFSLAFASLRASIRSSTLHCSAKRVLKGNAGLFYGMLTRFLISNRI